MNILTPKAKEPGRVVLSMEEAKLLGFDIKTSDKAIREITEMENRRMAAWAKYKDIPIGAIK